MLVIALACGMAALLLPAMASAAAPPNDDFANAAVVTGDDLHVLAEIGEATEEITEPRGRTIAIETWTYPSVWYRWTPATNHSIAVSFASNGRGSHELMLYRGATLDTLVAEPWAYYPPGVEGVGEYVYNVEAGTEYYIQAYSVRTTAVVYEQWRTVRLAKTTRFHDDFEDSGLSLITPSSSATDDTFWFDGATRQTNEEVHAGAGVGTGSRWTRLVVPPEGLTTVTINTQGSEIDTTLAVYTGDELGSLTKLAENDNAHASWTWSQVTFTPPPSGIVHVAIASPTPGATGRVKLSVSYQPIDDDDPPVNDNFADRIIVNDYVDDYGATYIPTATNTGTSPLEVGEPSLPAGMSGSVWYSATFDEAGAILISSPNLGTCWSTTAVEVFTGPSVDNLVLVGSVPPSPSPTMELATAPGIEYLIRLSSDRPAKGCGNLLQINVPTDTILATDPIERGVVLDEDLLLALVVAPEWNFTKMGRFEAFLIWAIAPLVGELLGESDLDPYTPFLSPLLPVHPDEPTNQPGVTKSRWITYVAEGTGDVTFHASTLGESPTWLSVYQGSSVTTLTEVDAITEPLNVGQYHILDTLESWTIPIPYLELTFPVVEGETYYLRIGGDDEADIGLLAKQTIDGVDYVPPVGESGIPPVNDNFADALDVMSSLPTSYGNTATATRQVGEPLHGVMSSGRRSIWYRWTATSSGPVTFDTRESAVPARLAIYTGGTVDSLTLITRDDGTDTPGTNKLVLNAVSGTTYHIALDAIDTQGGGDVQLNFNRAVPHDKFLASMALTGARGVVEADSTLGSSREFGEPTHGGATGSGSIWYSWTAPSSSLVSFDTSGSSVGTAIAAYTGSTVTTLVGVASSSPGPQHGRISFWTTSGTTYRIAVSPSNAALPGDTMLRWRPAENDRMADAHVVASASTTISTHNMGGASTDPGEPTPCAAGSCDSTLWYEWTAPVTGLIRLSATSSAFDPGLSLFDASGSTLLAANDDASPDSTEARVHAPVASGTTYLIRVESPTPVSSGTFSFKLNVAPTNDSFTSFTSISDWSGRWSGFNVGATEQGGEPNHAGAPADQSVWIRWTAPSSGTATIDTVGSDFDTRLAVYTGSVLGSLTLVTENDDAAGIAPRSAVSFSAVSGTTYRIAVDGANGEAGDVTVRINTPINDDISEAIDIVDSGWGPIPLSTINSTIAVGEPYFALATSVQYSVWYRWTITSAGPRVLRTPQKYVSLMLFQGSTYGTLTPVDGILDDRSLQSANYDNTGIRGYLTPGVYYVRAGSTSTGRDTTLSAPEPPTHDDLAAPRIITATPGPWLTEADAATVEGNETHTVKSLLYDHVPYSPRSSYSHGSTWFEWTATANGPATFSSTSTKDLVSVWEGGAASIRDLTVVPHATNGVATNVASIAATTGTTYLIRVEGNTDGSQLTLNSPPANDDIINAALLSDQTSDRAPASANNFGASCETGEDFHASVACSGTIWYRWRPSATGLARITTWGSQIDTVAAMYTGSTIPGITEVGSSGTGIAGDTRAVEFDVLVTAGTWYRIAVGSRGAQQGVVRLQVGMAVPGDRISEAIPVPTDTAVLTGTTYGATTDAVDIEPYQCGTTNNCIDPLRSASVWYEWTPSYTGIARIEYTGIHNTLGLMSDLSTRVAPLSRMESPAGSPTPKYHLYEVEAGTMYRIGLTRGLTGTAEGQGGPYTITVNVTVNDDFADARDLGVKYRVFDVVGTGSDTEPSEQVHGNEANPRSVWYKWTAAASGPVSFTTARSDGDTSLAAYTGTTLADLSLVAEDDDGITTDDAWIEFDAVAATTYWIALGVAGTAPTEVVLRRDVAPNDEPTHATVISGGSVSVTGSLWNTTWMVDEPGADVQIVGSSSSNWDGLATPWTDTNSPYRYALTWYRWTPPATGNVLLTTSDTGVDTALRVLRETTPGTYELIAENDNYGGVKTSRLTFDATNGEEVLIAVAQYYGSSSSYSITNGYTEGEASYRLQLTQVPINDNFTAPIVLNGWTASSPGSTIRATVEEGEPDHAGVHGGHSVWFAWTAPTNGRATISTLDADYDTALAVYTGSEVDDLTEVAATDDYGGSLSSVVSFQATAGTTYRIALDGYRSSIGVTTVAMNVAPPNDDLVNAFIIDGDIARASGVSTNATLETNEDDHAAAGIDSSVWWTWTPATNHSVTIDTMGSDFDTVLAVYTGTDVDALTEVASNDDSGGTTSSLTFMASAGTTYRIAVAGKGTSGDVEIRVNPQAPLVPELVAPIGGAATETRSGPLSVRVHHEDAGVLAGAQVETCDDAVAPADPWATNCTTGYVLGASLVTGSDGAVMDATLPSKLTMGSTYHWRARTIDSAGVVSTWSAPDTLTVGGTVTLSVTALGMNATKRGSGVPFDSVLPGTDLLIGPAGSGQITPGAAFEADVDAEIPAHLQLRATPMTNWNGGTIPLTNITWQDHNGGTGDAMQQATWTPFTSTDTLVETAPGTGITRFEHDLRITLDEATPVGNYDGSITYTVIAAP